MDYKKNYYDFLKNKKELRKDWKYKKYSGYEGHHILPKYLGGLGGSHDWQNDNIVPLTKREHVLVHYLWCKIHEHTPCFGKALAALRKMTGIDRYKSIFLSTTYKNLKYNNKGRINPWFIGKKQKSETIEKRKKSTQWYYQSERLKKNCARIADKVLKKYKNIKVICVNTGEIFKDKYVIPIGHTIGCISIKDGLLFEFYDETKDYKKYFNERHNFYCIETNEYFFTLNDILKKYGGPGLSLHTLQRRIGDGNITKIGLTFRKLN
jgi:hypothetical protein